MCHLTLNSFTIRDRLKFTKQVDDTQKPTVPRTLGRRLIKRLYEQLYIHILFFKVASVCLALKVWYSINSEFASKCVILFIFKGFHERNKNAFENYVQNV